MTRDLDEDDRREAIDLRRRLTWARQRCQCGNPDWPGSCPGPENCPCCQPDAPEGDEEDA